LSSLFGFYQLGIRGMAAARQGIRISGDNITNVNTPGFAKRRLDLTTGFPVRTEGGLLSQGVEIGKLLRLEDTLLQQTLEREKGTFEQLSQQRRYEDNAVQAVVSEINSLIANLVEVNNGIAENEVDGSTAAPLRDEQTKIVDRLTELTGGRRSPGCHSMKKQWNC